MATDKNAEYHYEMVVNIVAEMVVEYLKTTARDIDEKNVKAIKCENKEGNQGESHRSKNAA